MIPAPSPRRNRADAAPFFRLALSPRRVGGGSRPRTPPQRSGPSRRPPYPPRGARGAPSPSAPRAAAVPSSGRRAAPNHTEDKASKSQNQAEAQKTSPPGAHPTPPLTPPRRGRGGAGRLRRRGTKHFPWRGGGEKESQARGRVGKGKPCGRGGSALVPHAAPLPPSLGLRKAKAPPPLRQKKWGEGQRHGPRWGRRNERRD